MDTEFADKFKTLGETELQKFITERVLHQRDICEHDITDKSFESGHNGDWVKYYQCLKGMRTFDTKNG